MRKTLLGLGMLSLALPFAASAEAPAARAVLQTYADIAHAVYEDSLLTARALQRAVDTLVAQPGEESLAAAREAWREARVPYQQSEVYRFGNPIVDAWEGKVNAWPLDEGLIDYVAASYGDASDENRLYAANVIANPRLKLSGRMVDATEITRELLAETLHEIDGVEANVATGYHAVEFLLWGQDLNGTGPGAGSRPATDFDPERCTGGHCARRAAYLETATALLVDDLRWMTAQWAPEGAARREVVEGDPEAGLARILKGMGSLSYGELAGERMKLGLMLHDPEEEHDCFSDNTHWSHYYDVVGIRNVYTGSYERVDGTTVGGPSLAQLVAARDAQVHEALSQRLDETLERMRAIVVAAEAGMAYDQMLAEGNAEGNRRIMAAVEALTAQTRAIEKAVSALGLSPVPFEGSDSLDNPQRVG